MPAESSNLENSDPQATVFWAKSEGEEASKAMPEKMANEKCKTESKAKATTKRTCICAPTTHPGSFRCHLHRTNNAPPKLLLSSSSSSSSSSSQCLVDNNGLKSGQSHSRPQLSRFYTSASAKVRPTQDDKPVTKTRVVQQGQF